MLITYADEEGEDDFMERLYPETLLQIYFNKCKFDDERPTVEGLNKFAEEIAGCYKSGPHYETITDYIKRRQGDEPTQR